MTNTDSDNSREAAQAYALLKKRQEEQKQELQKQEEQTRITEARRTKARITEARRTKARITEARRAKTRITEARRAKARITEARITEARITEARRAKQGLINVASSESLSGTSQTILEPELGEFDDNFTFAMVLAAQGKK